MPHEQVLAVMWLAGVALAAVLLVAAFRARRRSGSYRHAAMGAIWEWQSQDKRRALELIVEDKAEARRPENRDGNLPELDDPDATNRT